MTTTIKTGTAARLAARDNTLTTPTTHLAPGYAQAALLIIPSQYATDFRLLCHRNPVALPLLAESPKGVFDRVKSRVPWLEDDEVLSHQGCDLRRDAPRYGVWKDGVRVKEGVGDVVEEWTGDHVGFLLASGSAVEGVLRKEGFGVSGGVSPHYKTTRPLAPSGIFYDAHLTITLLSSAPSVISQIRNLTAPLALAHGEPLDWGWGALSRLGIKDVDSPDYGVAPLTQEGEPLGSKAWGDGEVPVVWGSEVSGLEALVGMSQCVCEGTVMASEVGFGVVLDCGVGDLELRK